MTMPHLMNCPHMDDGWCLNCVGAQHVEIERLKNHSVILAETARRVEQERCARMADEYATWGGSNFAAWFKKLAAAIRG